ncbi:hypothetical protein EDB85DRAFT_2160181 [Lactarius pseudohatsudake]|nr:hypothetical protein EDB85DRAFT_2160181 [Lactarius pseudohatsudake]
MRHRVSSVSTWLPSCTMYFGVPTAYIPTRPSCYYPVEFNFEHICWAKVAWNPPLQRWDVNRPAGPEFHCDIDRHEIPLREEWGRLDGQDTPSSQAVPADASESETDTGEDESEEDHLSNVNPKEQEELAQLAAGVTIHEEPDAPAEFSSLHQPKEIYICEPEDMATATIAKKNQPPDHRWGGMTTSIPTLEKGTQKKIWRFTKWWAQIKTTRPAEEDGEEAGPQTTGCQEGEEEDHQEALEAAEASVGVDHQEGLVEDHQEDGHPMFVGQPPEVFTGDRTKTEEFLTQWELYWGVNNNNTVMSNPYQRAMIFLTYIRGSRVNEWLIAISRWLNRQVSQEGVLDTNPWLWTQVLLTFNQRLTDTLEKERVQATLKKGIKMRDGDIDIVL